MLLQRDQLGNETLFQCVAGALALQVIVLEMTSRGDLHLYCRFDHNLILSSQRRGCFRTEERAEHLIGSFFNLLGSSFKTRPTSEGG